MSRILQVALFFAAVLITMVPQIVRAFSDSTTAVTAAGNPRELSDHYYRGVTLEGSGRIDEAEKEYRKVLHANPAHGDARRRLAEICLLKGDTAGAIDQFKGTIHYQVSNPVVRFRLAQIFESNRSYRKATTEYQEAIRLAPRALPARRGLALLFRKRGMSDNAIAEYRNILGIDADDERAQRDLTALYLSGKKFDELTELLRQTAARKPNNPTSYYKLGVIYEFRKNYEGAAEEYGKAVELDKTHAKAMNALARVYLKTDRVDEAKKLLEAAGKLDPAFKDSALLLQNFNEEFKQPNQGKKRWKRVRRAKRNSRDKRGCAKKERR